MTRVELAGFSVEVPEEWGPIETSDSYDGPILGGPQRVGRLLFQVTPHSPEAPSFGALTPEQLLDLVKTFGETRFWESPTDEVSEEGPPTLAACSFRTEDGEFFRIWNLMDGLDYACISYIGGTVGPGDDIPLCERVVRSIAIEPAE